MVVATPHLRLPSRMRTTQPDRAGAGCQLPHLLLCDMLNTHPPMAHYLCVTCSTSTNDALPAHLDAQHNLTPLPPLPPQVHQQPAYAVHMVYLLGGFSSKLHHIREGMLASESPEYYAPKLLSFSVAVDSVPPEFNMWPNAQHSHEYMIDKHLRWGCGPGLLASYQACGPLPAGWPAVGWPASARCPLPAACLLLPAACCLQLPAACATDLLPQPSCLPAAPAGSWTCSCHRRGTALAQRWPWTAQWCCPSCAATAYAAGLR